MQILQANHPFWRIYCYAYGGGKKGTTLGSFLGGASYEGAVDGFVFVCPSSGTLQRKLYATTAQFPVILFQFLVDVERQHFVCRELYVDTTPVNLSRALEDVAALFQCRICPISAGTPQRNSVCGKWCENIGKDFEIYATGSQTLACLGMGFS